MGGIFPSSSSDIDDVAPLGLLRASAASLIFCRSLSSILMLVCWVNTGHLSHSRTLMFLKLKVGRRQGVDWIGAAAGSGDTETADADSREVDPGEDTGGPSINAKGEEGQPCIVQHRTTEGILDNRIC